MLPLTESKDQGAGRKTRAESVALLLWESQELSQAQQGRARDAPGALL